MTTILNPERIMTALNTATNALGMELSADARARIFAAIDNPASFPHWRAARSVIISERGMGETLWQAVARLNGDWYASPTVVPSSFTILDALERSQK